MKVAYHFDSQHDQLGGYYLPPVEKVVWRAITTPRRLEMYTKVAYGDLLLRTLLRADGTRAEDILVAWLEGNAPIWRTVKQAAIERALLNTVFVMCFDSVLPDTAREIDRRLRPNEWYLGAMEVDETSQVHWHVYTNLLRPAYRLTESGAFVFWDGFSEDTKDSAAIDRLNDAGLAPVEYEGLNGRHTIFDADHNFEHASRVATWKQRAGALLGFIAEDVVSRLSDTAPELGDRLYAALKALDAAETAEEYAQVVFTCRRLFEYVTDYILPPESKTPDGRDLGPNRQKNRLRAFAERQRATDPSIDLVNASVDVWWKQVEKLHDVMNKGVHASLYPSEVRRCVLRTILLLDDIASLRSRPLPVNVNLDESIIKRIVQASGLASDEE